MLHQVLIRIGVGLGTLVTVSVLLFF